MIKRILNNIFDYLKSVYKVISYYLKEIYYKIEEDQIWLISSGVAFSILLVAIPFILLLLTILGIYLDKSDTAAQINEYISKILPLNVEYQETVLNTLMQRVDEIRKNTFITGAIGIAGLFWTMSSLFSYLRDALNRIFKVKENLSFFKGKVRDFWLVLVIFLLFITSSFFTSIYHLSLEYLGNIFYYLLDSKFISSILPIILSGLFSFLMFLFLYSLVPHYKIPKKVVLISTLFATILFELMKIVFAYYVINLANYKNVYGTYAAFVIILLWNYILAFIFCLGALIGSVYLKRNNLKVSLNQI